MKPDSSAQVAVKARVAVKSGGQKVMLILFDGQVLVDTVDDFCAASLNPKSDPFESVVARFIHCAITGTQSSIQVASKLSAARRSPASTSLRSARPCTKGFRTAS